VTTIHARIADNHARKIRKTEPGRLLIARYRDMIEDPAGGNYTDAIAQPYGEWSDGQVVSYAKVHHLVAIGNVTKVRIPVGEDPSRDRARDRNQNKLNNGLPPEFTAEIFPGVSHEGDGTLSWPQDAIMLWSDGHGNEVEQALCEWASEAPLEIGHTHASRTLQHLWESGIVARWPYGSEDVWLFFFTTLAHKAAHMNSFWTPEHAA
jgi:hypothetical protein